MALTLTTLDITKRVVAVPAGDRKQAVWQVNFDNSYPTGGYAITPATFGLSEAIEFVDASPSSAAHPVVWNPTTSKIQVFTAQGAEVANATNLSAFFTLVQVQGL